MVGRAIWKAGLFAVLFAGALVINTADLAQAKCCLLPDGGCNESSMTGCNNQGGIFFDDPAECSGPGSDGECLNIPGTVTPGPGTPTVVPPATITPVPGGEEGLCNDNIDNDIDGDIDCADSECLGDPDCEAGAPALSPSLLIVLIGALSLFAIFRLSRNASAERG
jgi:hypothetical protein